MKKNKLKLERQLKHAAPLNVWFIYWLIEYLLTWKQLFVKKKKIFVIPIDDFKLQTQLS